MDLEAKDQNGQIAGPIRWFTNRDGEIGTGENIAVGTLSIGEHRIRAVFADDQGAKGATWGQYHLIIGNAPTLSITL